MYFFQAKLLLWAKENNPFLHFYSVKSQNSTREKLIEIKTSNRNLILCTCLFYFLFWKKLENKNIEVCDQIPLTFAIATKHTSWMLCCCCRSLNACVYVRTCVCKRSRINVLAVGVFIFYSYNVHTLSFSPILQLEGSTCVHSAFGLCLEWANSMEYQEQQKKGGIKVTYTPLLQLLQLI